MAVNMEKVYRKMTRVTGKTELFAWFVRTMDRLITVVVFLAYPMLLLYLYYYRRELLWQSMVVPGFGFVAVSMFRRLYNAPRPYETMDYTPVIHKETRGKSFPSRHVFSIFMIGMTFLQVDLSLGSLVLLLGIMLATLRVLGGVHFIRDVVAGAAVGILFGVIGYDLIQWGAFPFGG